jgi:hypothetical protein
MDSSGGCKGKQPNAAVGLITPKSFVGECALYPLMIVAGGKAPVRTAVPNIIAWVANTIFIIDLKNDCDFD